MSIIPFKPRHEIACEQNLELFIKRARNDLTIYEQHGGFYSLTWYVKYKSGLRGVMSFTQFESTRGKNDGHPFEQPFLDFARAYVREEQSIKENTPTHLMRALKAVHYGLLEVHGKADILLLDSPTIRKAAETVETRLGSAARYGTGLRLMKLYKWLKDNRICLRHSDWKSPWKKQKEKASGTSNEAKQWQKDRLLSSHEIGVLADAFSLAETSYQKFYSSLTVLLMNAPSRGGELHYLTTDCLFETTAIKQETDAETGEVVEKEITVLNLRWKAAKGSGLIPKPVHPKLEHVVREAVFRLTELSKPAREAASWAIERPAEFYRHQDCITAPNHDEDQALNYAEICAALGLTMAKKCSPTSYNLDDISRVMSKPKWFESLRKNKKIITYRDFAHHAIKTYKSKFPDWPNLAEIDRPVSEALCLVRDCELHAEFQPKGYSWTIPNINQLNKALGARSKFTEFVNESMFSQLGLTNKDASHISITSHQIRVWLSTMAERGEMDSLDLAMYAGRTRIEDNRHYDLRSAEEREASARLIMNIPKNKGLQVIESVRVNVPVTFEMLGNEDRVGTAQPTGWGMCEHDWTMAPCTKAGDCVTCKDHACIKGLPKTMERLKELENAQQHEFDRADEAASSGVYGADSWRVFQGKRLAVIRTVIRIMENDEVPDGTIIRIPTELDPTQTQVALIEKGLKTETSADYPTDQNLIETTQNELLSLLGEGR
ncbi:hypothetical protein [Vreelandella alkaliphila]|uniref:hypothetical protein n=1 Tax=Vreelandella alkaliphila TaxID=272774 RepID=UPI003FD743D0